MRKRVPAQTHFDLLGEAVDTAVERAEKRGYEVDSHEVFTQLKTGGVGYGETARASITLYKDGKEQRKGLIVVIYRMETGRYELTTYIN